MAEDDDAPIPSKLSSPSSFATSFFDDSERLFLKLLAPNAAWKARSEFTILMNVRCLTTRANADPSWIPSSTMRSAATFDTARCQCSRGVMVGLESSMVAWGMRPCRVLFSSSLSSDVTN